MTDSGGVARKEQGAGGCTAPAVDDMPSIYTTRNLEEGRTQLQNLVSMPMHMFKPIDSLLCSSAQLGLTPVFFFRDSLLQEPGSLRRRWSSPRTIHQLIGEQTSEQSRGNGKMHHISMAGVRLERV
jgi:hypothetical protein